MMKEQNNNRTKWLHLRLKPDAYHEISKKFSKSTCRKLSEYARKNLFGEPLTINYRNQLVDEFMLEIIRLRGELNALGNNFNQAVKKLHTLQQIPEFRNWIICSELEKKSSSISLKESKITSKK